MWYDPIVAEVRHNRELHAARFDFDIKLICRAARESQKKTSGRIVTLTPRRVSVETKPDGQPTT